MRHDHFAGLVEDDVDQSGQHLRRSGEGLRQRGEAPHIHEHYRNIRGDAAKLGGGPAGLDGLHHLWRQILAKGIAQLAAGKLIHDSAHHKACRTAEQYNACRQYGV